jgi:CheY-like chemotaxis protein
MSLFQHLEPQSSGSIDYAEADCFSAAQVIPADGSPTSQLRFLASYSDNPTELAAQMRDTQPERWAAFHHTEPRILIVDDNPRTAQRLADGLTALYGKNVIFLCDPLRALNDVRKRREQGNPYDLIITDLHMPGLSGTQLLKKLGEACPSVVVNSGSMLAPVLADLKVQMDGYTASQIERLLLNHRTERGLAGVPQAPILVELKGQPWKSLIDKVDSALFLNRSGHERGTGIAAFLEYFKPQLVPVSFSADTVHSLVEEVRNGVAIISPLLTELSALPEMQEPARKSSLESVLASLTILQKAHFSNILSEETALTWQAVHDLVGEFRNISPSGLSGLHDTRAHELVEQWSDAYRTYDAIISQLENGMRAYVQDEVDLRAVVQLECANNGISVDNRNGHETGTDMRVSDPGGVLRKFLSDAISSFAQCVQQNQNSQILVRRVGEGERLSERQEITRALEPLGAGAYYQVTFVDENKGSFDQTFSSIFRQLTFLREAGLAHFRVDAILGGASHFHLFVKVGAANVDLNQYRAQVAAAVATRDECFSLSDGHEINVYRDRGSSKNIICLGELPQKIDLNAADGTCSQPAGLVYATSNRTYVCTATSHREAAARIAEYIAQHEGSLTTNDVLLAGVRIATDASKGIQIEPESPIERSQRAREILIELGLLPARATISADAFLAKKVLTSSPAPLPEYVQAWFDGTSIINQLVKHFEISKNPHAQATVSAYEQMTNGASISEPSFVIRTTRGLTIEQQRALCQKLYPVMSFLELSSYEVEEFNGTVSIDGDAPRKSGLYLFDPDYRGRRDDASPCNFAHRLKPLISRGSDHRLGFDGIALREGGLLPKNALLYGGGDHSLTGCRQQWGLALAIELALQELQIPYESCRGDLRNHSLAVRFDGEKIETLQQGAPLLINLREFYDFE